MRSFRDYLKEDVTPAALVKDGSIDLERSVVRDQINSSLAAVTADPAVTPYIALNKISKVLSYFHIILPKRMYLEGDKGIEAVELRQFGEKMGMTDQGEFIKEVPGKYHLFVEYHRSSPMNITYAKPTVGGMFKVTAKVVDKAELDQLIAGAERALAEDAACQQAMSKEKAPKEPIHDVDSEGSESTKKAVKTSNRKSLEESDVERLAAKRETESMAKIAKHAIAKGADIKKLPPGKKKLGEESIDEMNRERGSILGGYISRTNPDYKTPKEVEKRREGRALALKKMWGDKKFGLDEPKVKAVHRGKLDELHGKGDIEAIASAHHKKAMAKRDDVPDTENPHIAAHARAGILKSMRDSSNRGAYKGMAKVARAEQKKREKIDEVSKETLASYIPKAAHSMALMTAKRIHKGVDHPEYEKSLKKQTMRHRGITTAAEKLAMKEEKSRYAVNPRSTSGSMGLTQMGKTMASANWRRRAKQHRDSDATPAPKNNGKEETKKD